MAEILKANGSSYDRAIALLKVGEPVALPTETVYGLAALATDDSAVANIYEIKGRPKTKPLSVVVSSTKAAQAIADVSPLALALMMAFWPGPLTLVLPLKPTAGISENALAGGNTIGMRCPDIPWMAHFERYGFHAPLVLPSANTSSLPAPTNAKGVDQDIGDKIPVIIDGGDCKTGIESTIIANTSDGVKMLRAGALKPEDFAPFQINWIVE
ncbi:MAG: threonylcarbamoyl-AMP synthase [Hyphomonadaceae bacterium]|nr:threonylcarbamoyl-AMP synthase [Hyphomonadaceae bacterium]